MSVTHGFEQDYTVLNAHQVDAVDVVDLRAHLAGLAAAEVLVLPSTWWTSATAHQLVNIAAWLRLRLVDLDGNVVETINSKAGRA